MFANQKRCKIRFDNERSVWVVEGEKGTLFESSSKDIVRLHFFDLRYWRYVFLVLGALFSGFGIAGVVIWGMWGEWRNVMESVLGLLCGVCVFLFVIMSWKYKGLLYVVNSKGEEILLKGESEEDVEMMKKLKKDFRFERERRWEEKVRKIEEKKGKKKGIFSKLERDYY